MCPSSGSAAQVPVGRTRKGRRNAERATSIRDGPPMLLCLERLRADAQHPHQRARHTAPTAAAVCCATDRRYCRRPGQPQP